MLERARKSELINVALKLQIYQNLVAGGITQARAALYKDLHNNNLLPGSTEK